MWSFAQAKNAEGFFSTKLHVKRQSLLTLKLRSILAADSG